LSKQKIIVAVLNWGLGHASRSVPIINNLLAQNFTPILASDGKALLFLQQEFPELESIQLPSYGIKYGKFLKLSLLFQVPTIYKAVKSEYSVINDYIDNQKDVVAIISDNRFGCNSQKVTSVYMTHQINVLSGATTLLTSRIHRKIIQKFDECWVPDTRDNYLSGKLSSLKNKENKVKYIGFLSRFKKEALKKTIDYLILLSGPEPYKTQLEKKLTKEFSGKENVAFVLGTIENKQKKWLLEGITFYNYLLQKELQIILNSSRIVICRSGYSTILDLAVLQKKAFFIPTNNQSEQEYLAKYLKVKRIAPFCKEADFRFKKIEEVKNYRGFGLNELNFRIDLHGLFQRK